MRRHYSGEVGEFTIFWCEISSGFCTPKIIKIDSFFAVIQIWGRAFFWDTVRVHYVVFTVLEAIEAIASDPTISKSIHMKIIDTDVKCILLFIMFEIFCAVDI